MPSLRADKLDRSDELKGEEDLSVAEAQAPMALCARWEHVSLQVMVEKYRLRSRAAEAAVQASVERFHRGKKLQD